MKGINRSAKLPGHQSLQWTASSTLIQTLSRLEGSKVTCTVVNSLRDLSKKNWTLMASRGQQSADQLPLFLLCAGGLHATGTEHAALVSKERILRDRNSQLSLPGKDFKSVLEILAILNREEEAAKSRERKVGLPAQTSP